MGQTSLFSEAVFFSDKEPLRFFDRAMDSECFMPPRRIFPQAKEEVFSAFPPPPACA